MPVHADYRPAPVFFNLGPDFADAVEAARFPKADLRFRNQRAAAEVGLDGLSEAEWIAAFGRFEPLPGQPGPLAMRYHGHQFRHYNPDLGDGRGFLAAQMWETPQATAARRGARPFVNSLAGSVTDDHSAFLALGIPEGQLDCVGHGAFIHARMR